MRISTNSLASTDNLQAQAPVFALHAKPLVVDRRAVYVGTYNLDPRSRNLGTEVGVVIRDMGQAARVAEALPLRPLL